MLREILELVNKLEKTKLNEEQQEIIKEIKKKLDYVIYYSEW